MSSDRLLYLSADLVSTYIPLQLSAAHRSPLASSFESIQGSCSLRNLGAIDTVVAICWASLSSMEIHIGKYV